MTITAATINLNCKNSVTIAMSYRTVAVVMNKDASATTAFKSGLIQKQSFLSACVHDSRGSKRKVEVLTPKLIKNNWLCLHVGPKLN